MTVGQRFIENRKCADKIGKTILLNFNRKDKIPMKAHFEVKITYKLILFLRRFC